MFDRLNPFAGKLDVAGLAGNAEPQIRQFLSENWPAISNAVAQQLGTAALDALRDDQLVGQVGKIAYGFLPGVVRLAVNEQSFVGFLADNRMKAIEWVGAAARKG